MLTTFVYHIEFKNRKFTPLLLLLFLVELVVVYLKNKVILFKRRLSVLLKRIHSIIMEAERYRKRMYCNNTPEESTFIYFTGQG